MPKNATFIAATGQHVGKTTLCLGMIAGLKKRFSNVGFIKPVGQQHVQVDENTMVDKDAVLFKTHFSLPFPWKDMSPVIIPSGFTRDYIDEKLTETALLESIHQSFQTIHSSNDYTIVEGTGHVGVGSIVRLNNAKVAAELGLEMVIIASGGLGSSYDELALNFAMCRHYGVKIKGVILNRVIESKKKMILDYFPRALKKWDIPLIGCVPFNEFLDNPTIRDYESLFETELLSGKNHHYRHFTHFRLVAGSVESYIQEMIPNELVITPATRVDIILATVEKHLSFFKKTAKSFEGGMILTGRIPPSRPVIQSLSEAEIPALYAPLCSFDTMKEITSYTAKIRTKDLPKIEKAINLVEENLNFDRLIG